MGALSLQARHLPGLRKPVPGERLQALFKLTCVIVAMATNEVMDRYVHAPGALSTLKPSVGDWFSVG